MREKTGGAFPQFYPRDDSTPENSAANRREGEEYLRAVLEESGDTRVVGEDLGTVPDYVRPSLRSLGIAGFKIPQWENHPDGRTISGNDYQRVSVATYATHDHKPVRAMWEDAFEQAASDSDQARNDLAKIAEFAGIVAPNETSDFDRDFYGPIMEALFRCESWLALVMITDLLARKDRFNVPGTATGSNWSRRLGKTVKDLEKSRSVGKRMRLIRELLERAGRV
jgi:4-alpha-glucanotransferase